MRPITDVLAEIRALSEGPALAPDGDPTARPTFRAVVMCICGHGDGRHHDDGCEVADCLCLSPPRLVRSDAQLVERRDRDIREGRAI